MKIIKAIFLISGIACLLSCQRNNGEYVCEPCDLSCDTLTFSSPGNCPHCGMELISKGERAQEEELVLNEIDIHTGSGSWLMEDGRDSSKTIRVFYHKPRLFSENSRILLVIPGAGRDADEYRDAWVETSEKHNILILSPMFNERQYGFEDYHLCGLIETSNLMESITYIKNSNEVYLDEQKFDFLINPDPGAWIFKTFDHIFNLATEALHSRQKSYDIFGHSAGGHILHRMALFQEYSKADRILASNASFYTIPSTDYTFPFGMDGAPVDSSQLKNTFEKKLVVFLGEKDNEHETGGTFLRSKTADQQGLHRLARGTHFFNRAKSKANESGYPFNWELVIIPGVGHDHELMGEAAGRYLYQDNH